MLDHYPRVMSPLKAQGFVQTWEFVMRGETRKCEAENKPEKKTAEENDDALKAKPNQVGFVLQGLQPGGI